MSLSLKRQPNVALFKCKAENRPQTQAGKKAIRLQGFLDQLQLKDGLSPQVIVIFDNNQGAIILVKNHQFHSQKTHISIQNCFIRELVDIKEIALE